MKKVLLCLTYLFPLFAFSQNVDFTNKDIAKKTLGIANSFKFDDHTGVFQIKLSDTTFELVAVDDRSQLLWRSTYNGYAVACGKFDTHILAISSAGYSRSKWIINPYTAYLIDEKTGNTLTQKEIFNEPAKHQESAFAYFTGDDTKFSLVIRQTHWKSGTFSTAQDNTEAISIVSLNEYLETNIIKPKVPEGTFVGMTRNTNGDFYFLTCKNNNTLQAWRYDYGNTEPTSPISLKCDTLEPADFSGQVIAASETDKNILYLGITYNDTNNDRVLLTGKLDFDKHRSKIDSEVFTGRYKRAIEKNYVPFDVQFQKPTIGSSKSTLSVKYIKEYNGKLIITLSESFYADNGSIMVTTNGGNYGYSLIINGYDSDLKKLFQQLMPVQYQWHWTLNSGFHFEDKYFNVISNNQGYNGFSLFGQLDMATGKWINQFEVMAKDGYVSDQHVIWFKDSFIVPLIGNPGVLKNLSKFNVQLRLNSY